MVLRSWVSIDTSSFTGALLAQGFGSEAYLTLWARFHPSEDGPSGAIRGIPLRRGGRYGQERHRAPDGLGERTRRQGRRVQPLVQRGASPGANGDSGLSRRRPV